MAGGLGDGCLDTADIKERAYHREMNAYLCTYRRISRSAEVRRQMDVAAKQHPLLLTFLKSYDESYYD
jgi:hypothetical protein